MLSNSYGLGVYNICPLIAGYLISCLPPFLFRVFRYVHAQLRSFYSLSTFDSVHMTGSPCLHNFNVFFRNIEVWEPGNRAAPAYSISLVPGHYQTLSSAIEKIFTVTQMVVFHTFNCVTKATGYIIIRDIILPQVLLGTC